VNAASFQIDDEEHEVANQPADRQHLNAEEVGRCDRALVSPQERAPRKRLASETRRPPGRPPTASEGRHLGQHGPAEALTLLGQEPALGVREPQAPRART
jgi:hypothetical protein